MFRRVQIDGTEQSLWEKAARYTPISYRWFGRSLTIADLDMTFSDNTEWVQLRKRIVDGDRICPFTMNPNTSAMRQGYVVIRKGQPVSGIVTLLS